MDCEKFDSHVIDALYDELDEVTTAALKRHVDGCSRCAGIWSGLRATREVGLLPLEEPSDGLEDRILAAAARVEVRTPWTRKLLRGLAWAGSHAMRPQLAMAALFFLVIGSSLLLLRARPGSQAALPVRVTERGQPAAEAEPAPAQVAAATAAPAAPSAVARAGDDGPAATAVVGGMPGTAASVATLDEERARDKDLKEGKVAADGDVDGQDAARKALAAARSTRDRSGCSAALGSFDQVGSKFPGTSAAADAMMDAASCYKSMGELGKARELLLTLRGSDGYRDRANAELNDLPSVTNQNQLSQGVAVAAPRAASPSPAAPNAAPPAKARTEPLEKPADTNSTSGKKAVAAPPKKAPSQDAAQQQADISKAAEQSF